MIEGRRRGRPRRIRNERADTAVKIWLTPTEKRRLEKVRLENHHVTIAETVREAVNAYVEDYSDEKVFSGSGNERSSVF